MTVVLIWSYILFDLSDNYVVNYILIQIIQKQYWKYSITLINIRIHLRL